MYRAVEAIRGVLIANNAVADLDVLEFSDAIESGLMMTQPRRVVIIDDHPMIRMGLAARISIEPDLEVCGEADDIPSALRLIESTHPDVAVVDIALRDGSGIDLIKRLNSHQQTTRTLVWSVYAESQYADRALHAGAMGYITKEAATDTIIDAIHCVLDDRIYASPELTQRMLNRNVLKHRTPGVLPLEDLSDRELDVFRLIGQGETTRDIASHLKLSPNTVETYRSRIRQKLNITNAASLARDAAQWVLENG